MEPQLSAASVSAQVEPSLQISGRTELFKSMRHQLEPNKCPPVTINSSTFALPTPTPASIHSHGSHAPFGRHIAPSLMSHLPGRNTNSAPVRSAIDIAGIPSTDTLLLPYGNTVYNPFTQGMTNLISSQAITPFRNTPELPLQLYTELTATPSALKPSVLGRAYAPGTGPGPNTPMSCLYGGALEHISEFQHPLWYQASFQQPYHASPGRAQAPKPNFTLGRRPPIVKPAKFKCREPSCNARFKRQEHRARHMTSHLKKKPYMCWVPGCLRAFSRSDNLSAHLKTHGRRGGRNRYVSTLDKNIPDYDPEFRGQLTAEGCPIYESTLEEPIVEDRQLQ